MAKLVEVLEKTLKGALLFEFSTEYTKLQIWDHGFASGVKIEIISPDDDGECIAIEIPPEKIMELITGLQSAFGHPIRRLPNHLERILKRFQGKALGEMVKVKRGDQTAVLETLKIIKEFA